MAKRGMIVGALQGAEFLEGNLKRLRRQVTSGARTDAIHRPTWQAKSTQTDALGCNASNIL